MSSLAALQSRVAAGLIEDRFDDIALEIAPGLIAAEHALDVHYGTVVSRLTNALRLIYPTVDWLVGEDFFDQAAWAFARARPPAQAQLSDYGREFAEFLKLYGPAADLAYLPDVARFDLAIDQVVGQSPRTQWLSVTLSLDAQLELDASLRLLRLTYPADLIRDAHADDGESLARLDLRPGRRAYALWRGPDGALALAIDPGPAAFLDVLLRGGSAEAGAEALLAEAGEAALVGLQTQVFGAPFARLQSIHQGEDHP